MFKKLSLKKSMFMGFILMGLIGAGLFTWLILQFSSISKEYTSIADDGMAQIADVTDMKSGMRSNLIGFLKLAIGDEDGVKDIESADAQFNKASENMQVFLYGTADEKEKHQASLDKVMALNSALEVDCKKILVLNEQGKPDEIKTLLFTSTDKKTDEAINATSEFKDEIFNHI